MSQQHEQRDEVAAFIREVVVKYPGQNLHGILENLNTHGRSTRPAQPPDSKHCMIRSPREVRDRIDAIIQAYNRRAITQLNALALRPSSPGRSIAVRACQQV